MKQKQSIVIFVNYKNNYDTTTTTANNSMGFDLSAIQSCLSCIFLLYKLGDNPAATSSFASVQKTKHPVKFK